jgi:hypothetical protein
MLLSQLIEKLSELKEEHGNITINIEVGHFGGPYGGHNCYSEAPIEDVEIKDDKILLTGWQF